MLLCGVSSGDIVCTGRLCINIVVKSVINPGITTAGEIKVMELQVIFRYLESTRQGEENVIAVLALASLQCKRSTA